MTEIVIIDAGSGFRPGLRRAPARDLYAVRGSAGRKPLSNPRGFVGYVVTGLLLLAAAVALSGCADKRVAFIQGDWFFSTAGAAGVTEMTSVYTYWNFDNGDVAAYSCCEDLPRMSGHYSVEESTEDALVLTLSDVVGADLADGYEVWIVINSSDETISIQGVGPFARMP